MKRLSWILTLPLMIVAIVFAVANRAGATLNLWPFGITVEAPLFVLVLGSALVGLLAGGGVAWLAAGTARRRAREAQHRAANLERELTRLRRERELEQRPPPGPAQAPRETATGAPAQSADPPPPSDQSRLPAARA